MTDDFTTPTTAPNDIQRLNRPEALFTAEYRVADLPGLNADELPESVVAPPTTNALPPPSPRQRRAALAAAARPGEAAARPGEATSAKPTVEVTVPQKPEPLRTPPPTVVVDLGATLPPRAEREAARSAADAASPKAIRTPLRRQRAAIVAIGAAVGCTLGYPLWAAVFRTAMAGAPPEQRLPEFLRESSATIAEPPVVAGAAPTTSPSPLPPALGATLAQALPPATSGDISSLGADTGAPPASSPAGIENSSAPALAATSPGAPSEETRRRAEALRAALETERTNSQPDAPQATPPAQPPQMKRRAHVQRRKRVAPPSSSERSPAKMERPEAPASPSRAGVAIRPLTTYTFQDKALFAVATAPMRVTDLVLERGETLVSQPTAGDAARWVISVLQGGDRSHVFVKPLRPGLRTNLTLTTNRRSYFLELSTREDGAYMAGVEWTYPSDDAERRRETLARAERDRQSSTAVSNPEDFRFDYEIRATDGARSWKPIMVFDDGQKTFIRFPEPVAAARAPDLLISLSGTTRDAKYVHYRPKGDLYVIDRLIDTAWLRLPSDDGQDVVRITRKQ